MKRRIFKYKCEDCEKVFTEEESGEKEVCLEEQNGVYGSFSNHTYQMVMCCPKCGSDDIYEYEGDDDDDQY